MFNSNKSKLLVLTLLRDRKLWALVVSLLATLGFSSASVLIGELSGPLSGVFEVILEVASGST